MSLCIKTRTAWAFARAHKPMNVNYTTLPHPYPILSNLPHTALPYATTRCITLHSTALHSTTLHYTTLHYTIPHYTTLRYTTLYYTTLHFTTSHHTKLYSITPYQTTLHYTSCDTTLQCHILCNGTIPSAALLCTFLSSTLLHSSLVKIALDKKGCNQRVPAPSA